MARKRFIFFYHIFIEIRYFYNEENKFFNLPLWVCHTVFAIWVNNVVLKNTPIFDAIYALQLIINMTIKINYWKGYIWNIIYILYISYFLKLVFNLRDIRCTIWKMNHGDHRLMWNIVFLQKTRFYKNVFPNNTLLK